MIRAPLARSVIASDTLAGGAMRTTFHDVVARFGVRWTGSLGVFGLASTGSVHL